MWYYIIYVGGKMIPVPIKYKAASESILPQKLHCTVPLAVIVNSVLR